MLEDDVEGVLMAADLHTDLAARAEKLEALVREWYERATNQCDLSVLDELARADYALESTTGVLASGIPALRTACERMSRAFPDLHIHIDEVLVAPDPDGEDVVSAWYTYRGTHIGPFVVGGAVGTVEPTGRELTWGGATLFTIKDWKMVRGRAVSEMMQVLAASAAPRT